MARISVDPTKFDKAVADEVAARTNPKFETFAQAVTWGADENVVLAAALCNWVYAQTSPTKARSFANHVLAISLVSAALPHLLKSAFAQIRPDRCTVVGHINGVPFSGKPRDAFPSGHAVHMGALASAAEFLPEPRRDFVRAAAVTLSLTRIALLAHWTSDVLAGFALGVAVERLMRPLTLGDAQLARDRRGDRHD